MTRTQDYSPEFYYSNCPKAPYRDQNVIQLNIFDWQVNKEQRKCPERRETTVVSWHEVNKIVDVCDDNKLG